MKQKNVILMVVAVGCGLVAAFLTSQMTAKNQEMVDVLVASKELSVGTPFTKEEIAKQVAYKKLPKEGLPPVLVNNPDDLIGKKLSRPKLAGETFNPADLSVGGVVIPDGYDMVAMPVNVGQAVAGFVGPGSRVDVLATVRLTNKLHAFPLLTNMQVLAVDTVTTYDKNGVFPQLNSVSFAVKDKQALLIKMAEARGCSLSLKLRHTNKPAETEEEINRLIKEAEDLLRDEQNPGGIKNAGTDETKPKAQENPKEIPVIPDTAKKPEVALPTQPEVIAPRVAVVKVPVAKADIAPNTDITGDLIADAFEWKELPKDFAEDAVVNLGDFMGKALKTGVAKGQWVTKAMVGAQSSKVGPQDPFFPPKPTQEEPKDPKDPKITPGSTKPVVARKTHDVAIHTPSGTVIYRYEEVAPGQWKKVAELTPEQAAIRDDKKDAPKAEAPAPDAPKPDAPKPEKKFE
jgi:Flp pilus assembly protein CpaB